jgi:hypothetical protein
MCNVGLISVELLMVEDGATLNEILEIGQCEAR